MTTARQIETHQFSSWDEILGNRKLKKHMQMMIREVVGSSRGQGVNTLVLGPSRSGKTSSMEIAFRAMACLSLNPETMNPCGTCPCCISRIGRYELVGLFQNEQGPEHDISFVPFNGNEVTEKEIDFAIREYTSRTSWRSFFYIDEIQGLVRRNLDHSLLKAVEQHPHITWIVSTATTKGLETMFRNRFTEVQVQLPTVDELAIATAKKCRLHDIRWDRPETLIELARRSKRIPGIAFKCVATAKAYSELITEDFLNDYAFDQVDLT